MKRHRDVTVSLDVMFVCGIRFAVSISRSIKFGTIDVLPNRKAETLLASIKRFKSTYVRRGFILNRVAAENEFGTLEVPLAVEGMALNVVACGEHVPEVERHIRTIKERCRAIYTSVPYRKIPNAMIVEMLCCANFWLHAFPTEDGISAHISPRELVSGVCIDANKHCLIPFGQYAQVHQEQDNSMLTRTVGAIALRPTGNVQGGHFFLSLETGKRIVRNNGTEIPATQEGINRVQRMAENHSMNRLVFGNRQNAEDVEPDEEEDKVIFISDSSSGEKDDDESISSDESDDSGAEDAVEKDGGLDTHENRPVI